MTETHSLGRLYVTRLRYRHRGPLLETGWTTEIEEPWRRGECIVIRLPFTRQRLAFGIWMKRRSTEKDNLLRATDGREFDDGWLVELAAEQGWASGEPAEGASAGAEVGCR